MLRTVLGWRCRWGPGRSLPTSYTSPRATNKPLIVFPIHTDRGHHCLSGFTPCLSHGPWFTPFENYLYSSVSFTQSLWFPEHNAAEQRGDESHKKFLLSLCLECCTCIFWPIVQSFFGEKKFTTFNSTDGQRCFPYNIIADIVAYYPLNRIIQTYLILINDLQQFYLAQCWKMLILK